MIREKGQVRKALPWAVTLIGVMGVLAEVLAPVAAQSNSAVRSAAEAASRDANVPTATLTRSEQRESADELLQLAIAQFRQYTLKDAEKTFQRVLALRQQQQDLSGQAVALNHLGEVYNELNETTKALEVLQQALAIYQQLNGRW